MIALKIVVIIVGILINMLLVPSQGTGDVNVWVSYIHGMRLHGAWQYLQMCVQHHCIVNSQDYPPGYYYILYVFQQLTYFRNMSPLLMTKTAIFIFSIVSCVSMLTYAHYLRIKTKTINNIDIVMVYVLNVSLLLNTQGLGYIDVFVIPMYIFFLLFIVRGKYFWGGIIFGLSLLIKWQPILSFPLVLLYVYMHKHLLGAARLLIGAAIPLLLVVLLDTRALSGYVESFGLAVRGDEVAVAAPNVVWLVLRLFRVVGLGQVVGFGRGMYAIVDQFSSPLQLGFITFFKCMFVAYYLYILYRYRKNHTQSVPDMYSLLRTIVVVMVGYFVLSSNVHENHLMLGVIAAMLLYISKSSKSNLLLLLQVDAVSAISMFTVYGVTGKSMLSYSYWGIESVTIVAMFVISWFCIFLFRNFRDGRIA